jgi:hypothetical protein
LKATTLYSRVSSSADLHERRYRALGLTDERILNSLTGHHHATGDTGKRRSLRTTLYQDQIPREVLILASEIRE